MNRHQHHGKVVAKRYEKKAIRKEVRDILKIITLDPDVKDTDSFFYSHLGWEQKKLKNGR